MRLFERDVFGAAGPQNGPDRVNDDAPRWVKVEGHASDCT